MSDNEVEYNDAETVYETENEDDNSSDNSSEDGELSDDENIEITDGNELIQNVSTSIIITGDDCITSDVMTKYEYARVVGIRATHIADQNQPYINIGSLTDPIDIAIEEIKQKRCPLSVRRLVHTIDGIKYYEEIPVNNLIVPTV